jgi:putative membrane protein
MFSLLANVVANAVAIWVATLIVPHVSVGDGPTSEKLVALLVVGAALAVVNAIIKPFVKFLTGCLYLLTFGLMALVVNAGMLKLAGWLAGKVGVDFTSGPFFWSTILAALVVTLVAMAVNKIFFDEGERRVERHA